MKLKALNEILPELIEGFVDDYEKGYIDRDDLIDGLATHIELEVKKRVEWFLKEIEKEKDFYYDYQEEQVALLDWIEQKIKKAFSGVVEE